MLHYTSNQEKPYEWDMLSFDDRQNYYPKYAFQILKTEDYLAKSIYSLESLKENYLSKAKSFSGLIGNEDIIMNDKNLAEKIKLQFLETYYLSDDCISKIDSMIEELTFYKESIYNIVTENEILSYACRLVIESKEMDKNEETGDVISYKDISSVKPNVDYVKKWYEIWKS